MSDRNGSEFDLLIRGGEVIDPGGGQSGQLDVAVANGVIAEVGQDIARTRAREVVDAYGRYVTPGLVDLHTHVYWGATYWGIDPDPVAARTGVTTWLDVGSAGSYNFPGLRRYVIDQVEVSVFSLLNLSAIGLVAPTWELSNLDYCDIDLARTIIDRNRDVILGIKARIDANTTRGVGIEPLRRARELADLVELPLMTHIGAGPPTIDEVIPHLRPGDIITHCFTGQSMKMLDENGKIIPEIMKLREQGLIFDIGHGSGSFSFDTTERMLDQGVSPDVISSDIHQMAIQGPAFNMPVTMSKFLLFGMSLSEIFERSTSIPARVMGQHDVGTLETGTTADIAVFEMREGEFTFQDVFMNERKGTQLLSNTHTFVKGKLLERVPLPTLLPWAGIPDHQRGKVIQLTEVPIMEPHPLIDTRLE